MKRLFAILILLTPVACLAQTTVNLSVIDTPDNQGWNNGTWQVQLVNTGNPGQSTTFTVLTGGGSVSNQSGSLSSTGTASMSLPANVNVGPGGSKWQFTVCSQAGTACSSANITVTTSGPQAVTISPPSIRVPAIPNLPPILVYTTTEISSASIGSQITVVGSTPGTPTLMSCTAVSGNTCTTWGGSSGGGNPSTAGQVDPTQSPYNVKTDAKIGNDGGTTNTQPTFTSTNQSCVSSDAGKLAIVVNTSGGVAALGTLTISANGTVGNSSAYTSQPVHVDGNTQITFTTTSTLASAGCSTTPQYVVDFSTI